MAKYSIVKVNFEQYRETLWVNFFYRTFFLKLYYGRNELIWQEGMLLDFLQKKSAERFVRRFLTITSYLVSERLFFEWVVRFYIDLVIWPLHRVAIFEFTNIGAILATLLILLLLTYLFVGSLYLFLLLLA